MEESSFAGAVILAGTRDFGRCPIASRLPVPLWPLIGRPLIYYQLRHLAAAGISRAAFCISSEVECDMGLLLGDESGPDVEVIRDEMPRGSAGCLPDAVRRWGPGTVLVIDGGALFCGGVHDLAATHRCSGAVMTILTRTTGGGETGGAAPAGVYVLESALFDRAKDRGFMDIKEELISEVLRSGEHVLAIPASGHVTVISGRQDYLEFVGHVLSQPEKHGFDMARFDEPSPGIWLSQDAFVPQDVRLEPPLVIQDDVAIGEGSVLVGPSVIGGNVRIGRRSVVDGSVLWEGCVVGDGACVSECIVDSNAVVGAGTTLLGVGVGRAGRKAYGRNIHRQETKMQLRRRKNGRRSSAVCTAREGNQAAESNRAEKLVPLALGGMLILAALAWSYWQVFKDLLQIWRRNDNFSSGALVPFLAVYVIYVKRSKLAGLAARPCYWGLLMVAAGFALRLAGTVLLFSSVERFSLLVVVIGLAITVFGFDIVRTLWGVVAFLFLMLPWPNRIYYAVSLPLQSWSTGSAKFLLEVLGIFVIREGNVLQVGDITVAVTEACSGLRMLTAFLVISALAALITKRPLWQKGLFIISSMPIAVTCNTVRLVATSLAYTAGYGEKLNVFFHDFGGLVMMPLSLAMLGVEIWLLGRLVTPPDAEHNSTVSGKS